MKNERLDLLEKLHSNGCPWVVLSPITKTYFVHWTSCYKKRSKFMEVTKDTGEIKECNFGGDDDSLDLQLRSLERDLFRGVTKIYQKKESQGRRPPKDTELSRSPSQGYRRPRLV